MQFHKPNRNDLNSLAGLFYEGKIRPIIDKTYPLEKTADAVRHLGEGNVKGKVVISITQ